MTTPDRTLTVKFTDGKELVFNHYDAPNDVETYGYLFGTTKDHDPRFPVNTLEVQVNKVENTENQRRKVSQVYSFPLCNIFSAVESRISILGTFGGES
ncbi:MAG: hypothetical protein WC517_04545 [Patescibacteria group bacterium]